MNRFVPTADLEDPEAEPPAGTSAWTGASALGDAGALWRSLGEGTKST